MLAGHVGGFGGLGDEVGAAVVENGFAALGWGVEGGGEEAGFEFAGLAQAAGVEVEAHGDRGEADEHVLSAECDEDAVDGVGGGCGAEGEGVAGVGGHAGVAMSKKNSARWEMKRNHRTLGAHDGREFF